MLLSLELSTCLFIVMCSFFFFWFGLKVLRIHFTMKCKNSFLKHGLRKTQKQSGVACWRDRDARPGVSRRRSAPYVFREHGASARRRGPCWGA